MENLGRKGVLHRMKARVSHLWILFFHGGCYVENPRPSKVLSVVSKKSLIPAPTEEFRIPLWRTWPVGRFAVIKEACRFTAVASASIIRELLPRLIVVASLFIDWYQRISLKDILSRGIRTGIFQRNFLIFGIKSRQTYASLFYGAFSQYVLSIGFVPHWPVEHQKNKFKIVSRSICETTWSNGHWHTRWSRTSNCVPIHPFVSHGRRFLRTLERCNAFNTDDIHSIVLSYQVLNNQRIAPLGSPLGAPSLICTQGAVILITTRQQFIVFLIPCATLVCSAKRKQALLRSNLSGIAEPTMPYFTVISPSFVFMAVKVFLFLFDILKQ